MHTFTNAFRLATELPGYAPGAAYRVVETMLGRVKNLGVVSDFTTQTGDFTGTSTIYAQKEVDSRLANYPFGNVFRYGESRA